MLEGIKWQVLSQGSLLLWEYKVGNNEESNINKYS
jgi:hypothetical protein